MTRRAPLVLLLLIVGLAAPDRAAWAQTRVLKCVDAAGQVSYLDAKACPGEAQGEEKLVPQHVVTLTQEERYRAEGRDHPLKPPTPEEVAERMRLLQQLNGDPVADAAPTHGKPRPQAQNQLSYRCSAAGGIWYRHSPCPKVIGQVGVTWRDSMGQYHSGTTGGTRVEQEVVTRSEACKAIESRASRPGRQLDEVPSSYEKLKGKDLC